MHIEWTTKLRRQKVQRRLLVVGNYRIYSIKRAKNGKKTVQREGCILEVKTLELTDNPDEIVLYWSEFNIHVLTPNAYTVAQLVRHNFQLYSCGFPEEYQIQLKVNDPSRLEELQPPEYTPAGGFRLTYMARCNQLQVPPHEPLIDVVEECGMTGNRVLCLNYVMGIDQMDLRPLTLALFHNTWFVALVLSDIPKPTALAEFSQLVAVNRTLMELSVDGTNPTKGSIGLLGDAMLKNPYPALEVINLRGIKISDDESLKLGLGFAGYKHFLTGLDISSCGLTGRSVTGIFAGLAANKSICTYLRVFKMSQNKLGGGVGSVEMARFFDRYAIGNEPRSMEELNMSDCSLDHVVISALVRRDGVVATLKEIDLSHNVLSGSIGASLVAMAKDSQCLRKVNLSNTRIDIETVELFLRTLTANEFLDQLEVDLSNNVLRIHGADAIDRGLRAPGAVAKIRAINLYNTSLGEDGLAVVVKIFENSNTLEEFDIGANVVKTKGGQNVQTFLTALSVFVTKHQSLRVLRIGGQSQGKLFLGKYIGPFLAVFATTRKIEELDVSGNQMGDDGISMLAEALRMNKTLKSLYWDENCTTPAGWANLCRALKDNYTLVHAQYPVVDIQAFAPRGRRGDRQRAQAESLMSDLSKILNRNQSGFDPGTQPRVRGQTFAQGYQADIAGGSGGPPPPMGSGGLPPIGSPGMKAPPPLHQAFPQGAPLDRQEPPPQQQQPVVQQPPRNMAPPPSMAQFQAQRGIPQHAYQQQAPPPPHVYQQQAYAQPAPPQQQYRQQPPVHHQQYQQPVQGGYTNPESGYAQPYYDQTPQYDDTYGYTEDLPPPPPMADFEMTEDNLQTFDPNTYGDLDLPPPPPPGGDW